MPTDPLKKVKAYFSPGRDCLEVVTGFIDRCTKTLDVACYSFTHGEIIAAMINASKRGVKGSDGGKPRLIVDKEQYDSIASMRVGIAALVEAGWDVRIDNESGKMHNKFVVGDLKTRTPAVLSGSFNWTVSAVKRNRENLLRVRIKAVIEQYHAEFERVWKANLTKTAATAVVPPGGAGPQGVQGNQGPLGGNV
jgi:phosphatidylserine/phosphatidylglycerophosphate/cardiolipin synthase-like enzyme